MTPAKRNYVRRMQQASKGGACDRIWSALRIMRQCYTDELMTVCELNSRYTVLDYLNQLRRAGYVVTKYGRVPLHEPALHILIRDTGPHHPAYINRKKTVWDPNTDAEYPL